MSSAGSDAANLSGVWPPNDTINFGGLPAALVSTAITFKTSSVVSGSKYKRSEVS